MGDPPAVRRRLARRARPDPDADLSDGVVVETDLVARVLGLRLLRLSGTIVLLPARVRREVDVAEPGRPASSTRRSDAGERDRPGARLAAVARGLDDNARRLARAAAGSGAG